MSQENQKSPAEKAAEKAVAAKPIAAKPIAAKPVAAKPVETQVAAKPVETQVAAKPVETSVVETSVADAHDGSLIKALAEIERLKYKLNSGSTDPEYPKFEVPKGEEHLVHARIQKAGRDKDSGKLIHKGFIQVYTPAEFKLFKSFSNGLGYQSITVLWEPK